MRRIAAEPLTATVQPHGDTWALVVTAESPIEPAPTGITLSVSLLSAPHEAKAVAHGPLAVEWDDLSITDITPFIVYRATGRASGVAVERATVMRASLVGDPPSRFDEIIAKGAILPHVHILVENK